MAVHQGLPPGDDEAQALQSRKVIGEAHNVGERQVRAGLRTDEAVPAAQRAAIVRCTRR